MTFNGRRGRWLYIEHRHFFFSRHSVARHTSTHMSILVPHRYAYSHFYMLTHMATHMPAHMPTNMPAHISKPQVKSANVFVTCLHPCLHACLHARTRLCHVRLHKCRSTSAHPQTYPYMDTFLHICRTHMSMPQAHQSLDDSIPDLDLSMEIPLLEAKVRVYIRHRR